MISKFFTIQHTAETQKTLKLRAVQLVTNFLNHSTDENLKSRIYEHHLELADSPLSLIVDKVALDQIFLNLKITNRLPRHRQRHSCVFHQIKTG